MAQAVIPPWPATHMLRIPGREPVRQLPGRLAGTTSTSPAHLRGPGIGQSHSATVAAGGRYQAPSPAAQTTRNRVPPQDFAAQQALYRRPHHSQPPGGHGVQAAQQVQQQAHLRSQQALAMQRQAQVQDSYLQQMPGQQQQLGGSSPSVPVARRAAAQTAQPDPDFSDDDIIGPGMLFSQKKEMWLIKCIVYLQKEMQRQQQAETGESRALLNLFNEDQYYNGKGQEAQQYKRFLKDASTREVANWVLDLLDNGYFDVCGLISCLIYLKRFRAATQLGIHKSCFRPLFITALLLADKYFEDKSVKNSSMASLFPVLSNSELFILEVTFLEKLKFSAWLTRQEFKAFCKDLEMQTLEMEVLQPMRDVVRSHKYLTSDTFTRQSDAPQAQQALGLYGLQNAHSCPSGHFLQRGAANLVGKPVQPWNSRRTMHSAGGPPKKSGHPSSSSMAGSAQVPVVEDGNDAAGPSTPVLQDEEHDRKALLDGVSPRRSKAVSSTTVDNGGYTNSAHRSPRTDLVFGHSHSQTVVGESSGSNRAMQHSQSQSQSPQPGTIRTRNDNESKPRLGGPGAGHSPRRAGASGAHSGPALSAGRNNGATPTSQAAMVRGTSPQDDPCNLPFAQKTALYEPKEPKGLRAHSDPTRASHAGTPSSGRQVPQQMHMGQRGGVVRAPQQQMQRGHSPAGNASAGLAPGASAQRFGFMPNNRNTIPVAGGNSHPRVAGGVLNASVSGKQMVQAAGTPGKSAGQVQVAQGNNVLHASRARSSSPAYTGANFAAMAGRQYPAHAGAVYRH